MAVRRPHRAITGRASGAGRWGVLAIAVVIALGACSSSRDAGPLERPTVPTTTTSTASTVPTTDSTVSTSSDPSTSSDGTSTTTATSTTVAGAAPGSVTGVAVAGTAGGVETPGAAFTTTDPFAEAVRLSDGTCVGWPDSKGGSTAGLAVGAPVSVLAAEANDEIGTGTITASRWADMSQGGSQFNCLFDFTATVTGAPAEFRIKVGGLDPWLARPDPTAPSTFTASVSTDASIGLIPSCPAVPTTTTATTIAGAETTTTIAATTLPAPPVTAWNAVGQYWSNGVASLCGAGLPVTAIARPCRPPGFGSEYIVSVVDSDDPTVTYANGAAVPLGTALTVVVATGRPCG